MKYLGEEWGFWGPRGEGGNLGVVCGISEVLEGFLPVRGPLQLLVESTWR